MDYSLPITKQQILCHISCVSLVLAYVHAKARKSLCSGRLEKTPGLAWTLMRGALRLCSGGRRRSLTTREYLWTPRRPALRQSVVGEKPGQHVAGLLLFDDTGKCPTQPEDASGGTYTRHCARVQDPLYALSCSRDRSIL